MSNPSFGLDILKIGWTRNHPAIRASSLFTSGVPTPFQIEFIILTDNGLNLETQIHNHIKDYRLNHKREFFKISKEEIFNKLKYELNLEISNDILNIPNDIKSKNIIYEIVENYERVDRRVNEFLNKLKKNNTMLQIKQIDEKISHVYVTPDNTSDSNCLHMKYYDDEIDFGIVLQCEFIERDMKSHKQTLDMLLKNHKEIKENLGGRLFRSDNLYFKKIILETENKLDALLNKCEWSFD